MTEPVAYVNDTLVPVSRARLAVGDLSVQRGYAVFDFFKTINGRPVFLDDHLDRLDASAAHMRLPLGRSRAELLAILRSLMDANAMPDSGVRITVTGGDSPDGYSIAPRPNLIITQSKLVPPPAAIPQGIRLITHEHLRQLPTVKTTDYLMAVWLQPLLRERNADDVLYTHSGLVSECPRCNVFVVTRAGQLLTPDRDVLKGVTRKHVLDLARAHCPVAERPVTVDDVRTAAEVFITSTTKAILPITHIDGTPIGNGAPGELTRVLRSALLQRIASAQAF